MASAATHSKVDASTGDVMLKILRDNWGLKPSLNVISLFEAEALVCS